MKKVLLTICLFTIAFIGFSQNKKEQIEELNLRIDSCKIVLTNQSQELNSMNIKINELEQSLLLDQQKKKEQDKQIAEQDKQITELTKKIYDLENPPLTGKYSCFTPDFGGINSYFYLEISNHTNNSFMFNYEYVVYIEGDLTANSTGNGHAKLSSKNTFITERDIVDKERGEYIKITFTKTSQGLEIELIYEGTENYEGSSPYNQTISLVKD